MYQLKFHRAVEKELDGLPDSVFKKVSQKVALLKTEPRRIGSTKLDDGLYRIRVGEYRIIYRVLEKEQIIILLRVARRSEKTYRNLPS